MKKKCKRRLKTFFLEEVKRREITLNKEGLISEINNEKKSPIS